MRTREAIRRQAGMRGLAMLQAVALAAPLIISPGPALAQGAQEAVEPAASATAETSPGDSRSNRLLPGRIVVDVITDPPDDPTFFDYTLLRDGEDAGSVRLAGPNGPRTSGDLAPGAYRLEQALPGPDWTVGSAGCTSSSGDAESVETISLAPGEVVACVFRNSNGRPGAREPYAEIRVDVTTTPSEAKDVFGFIVAEAPGGGLFPFGEGVVMADETDVYASGPLVPGTYTVRTVEVAGWQIELVCESDTRDAVDAVAPISVSLGERVSCAISPRAVSRPAPALSPADKDKLLGWIGAQVASQEQPYCYRSSYGRGVGVPMVCPADKAYDAGLCYPKARAGYTGVGPVAWQDCPPGFTDIGVSCAKPSPYGRGTGYPWKFGDGFSLSGARTRCERAHPQGCETWGAIYYPTCKPDFHNVGCCICSPDCPTGMRDDGAFCAKDTYGRGVGAPVSECRDGLVEDAWLCYTPCKNGFHGVGPVCWQDCPSGMVDCGAGCSSKVSECVGSTVDMVMAPGLLAVTALSKVATLAKSAKVAKNLKKMGMQASKLSKTTAGIANEAARVARTKGLGQTSKAAQYWARALSLWERSEPLITGAKNLNRLRKAPGAGDELGKDVGAWIREYGEIFDQMTSPRVVAEMRSNLSPEAQEWVREAYAGSVLGLMMVNEAQDRGMEIAQDTLAALALIDPSGVLAVAAAYTHPICRIEEPFPAVTPAY